MESQRLRTDVPPRVYAYMALNAPTMQNDSELARYWIEKGIKAEISEKRCDTGQNLDLNQELVNALDMWAEYGTVDDEAGSE